MDHPKSLVVIYKMRDIYGNESTNPNKCTIVLE